MTEHDAAEPAAPAERARRTELAGFLRTRRERLLPQQVGLPARARRRTPGLRREEVAELIGVGVTWYTWLEQGRPVRPSAAVLANVARVFRLSGDERAYLFRLAQRAAPPPAAESPDVVRPAFREVVTALEPAPAHIRDRRWNVLAWNRAEARLVDWGASPPGERNIVWHHFADPAFRRLLVHWEREARSVLSEFRMESVQRPDDPWLTGLVGHLHERSPEFRRWWPLHEVRGERELPVELAPPGGGRLLLQPVTLAFTADPRLTLRVLVPASEAGPAGTLRSSAGGRQSEG
jgi:transcriptional regulator with XRE-family HTH domain